MSGNKNYTKALIIIFCLFLFLKASAFAEEDFKKQLNDRFNFIKDQLSWSVLPVVQDENPESLINAVAIDKNLAIIPANSIGGGQLSLKDKPEKVYVVAIDSGLNIAIVKIDRQLNPVKNFQTPSEKDNIFLLITVQDTPYIHIVKGKLQDKTIMIEGKYVPGSLLVSPDLLPIGIITRSDKISEALALNFFYSEIKKLFSQKPGWLGIQGQSITRDMEKIFLVSEGVVITNIYENGPSDKAGLKRSDVIVEVNGVKIKDLKSLQDFLATKFAGEVVNIKIMRDGSLKNISITLEEPPESLVSVKPMTISKAPEIKGVEVTEIPETIKSGLRKSIKGVFVKKISENSPVLGILKEGDIVIEINKQPISSLKDFNEVMAQAGQRDLLVLVYRQDSFQYVIIPLQKSR